MRVERSEVTARAGGDPAAERRELEALRIMTQGEAMRLQRRFDRRPKDAGLNARGAARRVHFEHAVQAPHVEADGACVAVADQRLDAADHRRAGAERHDRNFRSACPVEHSGDVGFGLRQRDEIGCVGEIAGEGAHGIRVGLAVSVQQSFVRISREHVGERSGGRDAGSAERDVGGLRGRRWRRAIRRPVSR